MPKHHHNRHHNRHHHHRHHTSLSPATRESASNPDPKSSLDFSQLPSYLTAKDALAGLPNDDATITDNTSNHDENLDYTYTTKDKPLRYEYFYHCDRCHLMSKTPRIITRRTRSMVCDECWQDRCAIMGGPTCADEVGFSPRRRVVVMGETEMGSISSVLRERFGAVSAGGGLGRLEEGDLGDRGEGDGEEEGFGYGLAFYAWVEEAVELPGELEELNGAGDAVELLQVPQGFLQDYFNHQ